jgi:hypothetical protein
MRRRRENEEGLGNYVVKVRFKFVKVRFKFECV